METLQLRSEIEKELEKVRNSIADVQKRRIDFIEQGRKGKCWCCGAKYPSCDYEYDELDEFDDELEDLETMERDLKHRRKKLILQPIVSKKIN